MSILVISLVIINYFAGWFSPVMQLDLVRILSPQDGEVLQGKVPIKGTVTGVGLQFTEVSFQYQENPDSEWFLISRFENTVVDDTLVNWETALIADGTYRLRVVAHYSDGNQLTALSEHLRIRNYTPIETSTSIPEDEFITQETQAVTPTIVLTSTLPATATTMPENELELSLEDIQSAALSGAIFGSLLLVILGIWLILRHRRMG